MKNIKKETTEEFLEYFENCVYHLFSRVQKILEKHTDQIIYLKKQIDKIQELKEKKLTYN